LPSRMVKKYRPAGHGTRSSLGGSVKHSQSPMKAEVRAVMGHYTPYVGNRTLQSVTCESYL
jgi:hypothetical protein